MAEKTTANARPKRTPISTSNVLTAEGREGYHQRFVNDVPGRITRFLAAGYTHVNRPDANTSAKRAQKPSSMGSVVSEAVGNGMIAYLMEIPMEFYLEDQAAKMERLDALEAPMMKQLKKDSH